MRTSTKISQTWLASHTGPIECSIRLRWLAPRFELPARRSQMPAPKSAPASSAYAVTASHITASSRAAYVMGHTTLTAATSDSCGAIGTGVDRVIRRST